MPASVARCTELGTLMRTVVVIPCLNEQATLAATCASLGFGLDGPSPDDVTLVLVDNGSDDDTPAVMGSIRQSSPDRVILAKEPERGYVPPRHRGVLVAAEELSGRGAAANEILVLQADADTLYDAGYVAAMQQAADGARSAIFEGVAHTAPDFLAAHPGYHALATVADHAADRLTVEEADEVIIDDKVAGYRLSDYFAWGGHRREYDRRGDEIHAETSRLFIRGKAMGARRVRAGGAVAFPSRRKIELDPVLHFATGGFPREASWCVSWRAEEHRAATLDSFDRPDAAQVFAEAIFNRGAHHLILFGLIPAYVARRLGLTDRHDVLDSPLAALAEQLSSVSAADIASHPGRLLEAAFSLIESHRQSFEACLDLSSAPQA